MHIFRHELGLAAFFTGVTLLAGCLDPYVINRPLRGEAPIYDQQIWECWLALPPDVLPAEAIEDDYYAEDYFSCLAGTGPPASLADEWTCGIVANDTAQRRPLDCRNE